MWTKIKDYTLIVRAKSSRGIFTIPEGLVVITTKKLFDMLEWLHEEFITDCKNNENLFEVIAPSEEKAREDFTTRNTSRTLSYIVQLFILEKVLIAEYKDCIKRLKLHIDQKIEEDNLELKKRAEEIEYLKFFRDKVAAHTAFASPRAEDNLAMQFDSLMAILGIGYNQGDIFSFRIGVSQIRLGNMQAKRKIPEIGLCNLHPKIIQHFQAWERMFINKLEAVQTKLPQENIEYIIQIGI